MPFPVFVLVSFAIAVVTMAGTARLSGRLLAALVVAASGAAALLLFHGLGYFHLVVDDAFINFRYSQHLADGLGPNWNSDGRVEGYTNFLWMAILAGVAKLGFDIVVTASVLGGLAVCATAVVLFRLWRLWGTEAGDSSIESPIVFAAVLVGLALNSGVAFWAFAGLETPLFMALLTGGAYLHLIERRAGGMPWSAVVFAALAMTRPEGLIVAAVTGLFKLLPLADSRDRTRDFGSVLLWISVFLGLYGSYFIWRYSYYDYLLPNTFYAKVGSNLASFNRGLDYLIGNGVQFHLLPMLIGAAVLLTIPKLRQDVVYILFLCGSLLSAVVFEGGDFMVHGRFVVPVLPLLYLSGLAGFAVLLKKLGTTPMLAAGITSLGLGLAGLMLLQASYSPLVGQERLLREDRVQLGSWLKEYTPPDYSIAAHAVGAIAYYSDRDVLDLLGVNDAVAAVSEAYKKRLI